MVDEGRGERIIVEKRGFPDAVTWNPWADKAAGMSDFGDDEYKAHCLLYIHPSTILNVKSSTSFAGVL